MIKDCFNLIAQNIKTYVYGLVDPRNNIVKYVGVTKNSINQRLNDHVRDSNNANIGNKHKNYWIQQLLDKELTPEIVILEECKNQDDAYKAEIWWIDFIGIENLTNVALGGDRPPSWKGRKHSEETKQKQSESIRAYYAKNDPPRKGKKAPRHEIEKARKTKIKNGTLHKNWTDCYTQDELNKIYQRRDTMQWRNNLKKHAKKRFSIPENNVMYGKNHRDDSKQLNRISNWMYHANKNDDWGLLFTLQEEYYAICGRYQEKYFSPINL